MHNPNDRSMQPINTNTAAVVRSFKDMPLKYVTNHHNLLLVINK